MKRERRKLTDRELAKVTSPRRVRRKVKSEKGGSLGDTEERSGKADGKYGRRP